MKRTSGKPLDQKIIKASKVTGRDEVDSGSSRNDLQRHRDGGGFKNTQTGKESDGGTTGAELTDKAHDLYSNAVENLGVGGNKGLQER